MWAAAITWANAHVGLSIDPARGHDYGAAVKWWMDEKGNLHIVDVQLIEPPHTTIETHLVPGSDPPRYEAV